MRRLPPILICVVGLAVGLPACGSDEPDSAAPSPAQARKALAGAPAPLAALHAQANELLDGGPQAFEQRLAGLKGHPVVVNKWASWCDPCRRELPHFQRQALKHGKRIAFLGVDSNDNDGDAREFLAEFPVSYPSYKDPDLKVSAVFNGVAAFPTTAFYDSKGKLAYVKQGVYLEEKDLVEDIERYAR
jgi:cytochrome c biogenesis protein CcmG, thiol:disulfide interchange protein DsbE